jgi:catechol 2,3-dioxygenase-like lactoylglutathione lyase family enzyme
MEHDLRDFGNQKLQRRQLLKGLGLTATAAFAASAMPRAVAAFAARAAQSAGDKAFPVTTINHLSLAVADYAKSRDFYVDLFGMRVRWDDGKRCEVQFGSMTSPNGMYIGGLSKPGDAPSVVHVAFGLSDFWAQRTAIKEELDRRGVKIGPDGEGGWTFDEPAKFMSPGMQVTPFVDPSMFPGAGGPCLVAKSDKCNAAWEAGLKMPDSDPKPSGNGLKATAFSHIVFSVPDVAKERNFFTELWGMKVVSEKSGEICLLKFGSNTLDIRQSSDKPHCNSYGFVTENFNRAKVEAELKRRSLDPQPDPKWTFAIKDPDGLVIGVTANA